MSKKIIIGKVIDFPNESARVVTAEGVSIVVARLGDEFCAVANKCPHLGFPLTSKKVDGKVITCPFHGSQFDMCSGENIDWVRGVAGVKLLEWSRRLIALGRQPSSVQTFPIMVEADYLFVEV